MSRSKKKQRAVVNMSFAAGFAAGFAVAKKNTGKTPASQLSIIIKLKWKIWKFMRISLRFWGYRPGAVMLPAHQTGVWITFSASSS